MYFPRLISLILFINVKKILAFMIVQVAMSGIFCFAEDHKMKELVTLMNGMKRIRMDERHVFSMSYPVNPVYQC